MTDVLESARRILRPTAAEAAEAWRTLVTAEREQVESLPNRPRPEDFYGPIADAFKADPHRSNEPLLDRLRTLVRSDETWLDLGAGGGRYTLPLTLLAKRMYAVEPSQGMREVLAASAAEHGITNLDIFGERWPSESKAPVADVAFMSQVGYDISDIGPFLDQFEAHANRLCVAVLFDSAPISDFAALWRYVHGEDRILLPGMGEFAALLFARGRVPQIELLPIARRRYESVEALHQATRRPIWVLPETPEDERLGAAVRELALEYDGGFSLSARDRKVGIVSWEPS